MKSGTAGSESSGLRSLLAAALLIVLSVPLAPVKEADAALTQEPGGRFRVLVVPVESGALDKKFGEKVAEEIRKRLEDFATHAPIPEKEFERSMKRYEVKLEELNAIKARQLANLIGAQQVFYGVLQPTGTSFQLRASFIDVKSGDEIAVPPITVNDKGDPEIKKVATASISAFQKQVDFLRARQFCADYVGSQQPENALRNCNEALAINSTSVPALFNKGMAFRQLFEKKQEGTNGWADSAIVYFEKVLQNEPGKREALQNAAYIYSQVGQADKASQLYKQYLELDPGNVPVRLKVAYDLAQAGLMRQAIEIIQQGIEFAEKDVDLLQSLGDYALRYSTDDSTYVDIALRAYEQVLDIKGEQTDLSIVENALAAYTRANRSREAVAFAEKALKAHAGSPRLWSLYADALTRLERYQEAAAAMDKVIQLDASYQNAYLKRGQLKLQQGNEAAAMADFQKAIETGSSSAQDVFGIFWNQGHAARSESNFGQAAEHFQRAYQFAPADKKREVDFWWGYTYYQLGETLAKPDKATVAQLQRAQQAFQSALQHFERAGSVRKESQQFHDAASKWILNVEARIKQISRG